MNSKNNFYIQSFGCQMNDRDTERISCLLYSVGYSQTDDPLNASILILNTCSIRKKAELKAYSALGRFRQLKEKDPSILIGIGGCVAQQEGRKLLESDQCLDFVFGPHAIHRLPGMIERSLKGERSCETDFSEDRSLRFQDYRFFNEKINPVPCNSYVKSFVTIMEGCDNMCSYCVVPRTRGKETSRPTDDIIAEIKGLVQMGIKEVTLLGQNVNSYGKKDGFVGFPKLLELIDSISGLKRLRFTTSHPKDLSEELIASFGKLRSLCPHIHLPLQSGSSRILEK
jgi:tRNA-2-methylthio-N6-dimethylallyladenosine synthase